MGHVQAKAAPVGAGLYEHRIVVPDWISSDAGGAHWNARGRRSDDTGLRFWAFVSTGPLTTQALSRALISLGAFPFVVSKPP